jgi:RND family efflux transporter MFP subunit
MSGGRARGGGALAVGLALALALATGCREPGPDEPRPQREPITAPLELVASSFPVEPEGATEAPSAYVGVVIAPQAVELAAEVPGTMIEQGAALGDWVAAGTLLARVQTPTLPAEIEAAEAALAQVEAVRAEQELLIDAAAQRLAQEQRLASAGVSTSQERSMAQLELDRARAVKRRLVAQQAERRAELHRLHAQRDTGRVMAPFSGTVSTWYRPVGAVVSPGDRLVRLVAVDRLWVRFAVPVSDLHLVRPGQVVDVMPGPQASPQRATIRHVAPELDLASQRMLVEAELHEAGGLKAAQACHVSLRSAGPGLPTSTADREPVVVSSTEPAAATGGT